MKRRNFLTRLLSLPAIGLVKPEALIPTPAPTPLKPYGPMTVMARTVQMSPTSCCISLDFGAEVLGEALGDRIRRIEADTFVKALAEKDKG